MVRSAFSASFLIVAGTFGSFVANASWTLTSPLSIWTDFTRPNETISRVKPGYFTDFKALFTCSSEIVIPELTRAGLEVNRVVRFSDRFWGAQGCQPAAFGSLPNAPESHSLRAINNCSRQAAANYRLAACAP